MRGLILAGAIALLAGGAGTAALPAPGSLIAAAVGDARRPATDTARDPLRKPADVLAFAGVKPGDTVAELIPGKGYFTRLLAAAVGPKGHVYAVVPQDLAKDRERVDPIAAAYPNVSVIVSPLDTAAQASVLDLVWTSQNYHDLHIGTDDVGAINKAIFRALKPGGVYFIVDHAAAPGSGLRDTNMLHRIDPEVVKTEVEAAGFRLEAASDILRNPADPHSARVFDPSIRGRTDQFILKFRKPR